MKISIVSTAGTQMTLMSEDKDDEFLSKGQAKEEEIFSIDYDVWVCKDCKLNIKFWIMNLKSKARNVHTVISLLHYSQDVKRLNRPPHRVRGYGYDYFLCANCGKETEEQFIISQNIYIKQFLFFRKLVGQQFLK